MVTRNTSTFKILAALWGSVVIPAVGLLLWYYVLDPTFWRPAFTDHEYTHVVDKDYVRQDSFPLGEDVHVVGRGAKLRSDCFPTFERRLKKPDDTIVRLPDGHGFRKWPGIGTGSIRIDGSHHSLTGKYTYYSWGIWRCDYSVKTHRSDGWEVEYTIK